MCLATVELATLQCHKEKQELVCTFGSLFCKIIILYIYQGLLLALLRGAYYKSSELKYAISVTGSLQNT